MKNLGITFPCMLILLVILTGFAVPQAQAAGDRCWTSKPSYLVGETVVIYVTMTQIASYYLDVTNQASHVTTTYYLGYVSSPPKTTTVTGTASLPTGVRTMILRNSLGQSMYCPLFEVRSSPPSPPPSRPTYQLTIKVWDSVTRKPVNTAEVTSCGGYAHTDRQGMVRYSLNVKGDCKVTIIAMFYHGYYGSVYVDRDTVLTVLLRPLPPVTVTVFVEDRKTGAPVSYASVYVDGVYKGKTIPFVGMIVIAGVTLGQHKFFVTASGYYPETVWWTIYPEGRPSISMRVPLRPIA